MAATATFARSVVSQFVGTSVSTAAKTVSTRAICALPRQGVRAAPLGLSLELPFAGQLRPAVLSRNFSQIKAAALDEEFSVETAEDTGAAFDAPAPAAAAPPQGTKLYVGNLPWSVDSESLAEHFQQVGNVDMVEVRVSSGFLCGNGVKLQPAVLLRLSVLACSSFEACCSNLNPRSICWSFKRVLK